MVSSELLSVASSTVIQAGPYPGYPDYIEILYDSNRSLPAYVSTNISDISRWEIESSECFSRPFCHPTRFIPNCRAIQEGPSKAYYFSPSLIIPLLLLLVFDGQQRFLLFASFCLLIGCLFAQSPTASCGIWVEVEIVFSGDFCSSYSSNTNWTIQGDLALPSVIDTALGRSFIPKINSTFDLPSCSYFQPFCENLGTCKCYSSPDRTRAYQPQCYDCNQCNCSALFVRSSSPCIPVYCEQGICSNHTGYLPPNVYVYDRSTSSEIRSSRDTFSLTPGSYHQEASQLPSGLSKSHSIHLDANLGQSSSFIV